jgi:hypothetical protein
MTWRSMDPWGVRVGVPVLGRLKTLMHIVWLHRRVSSVAAGPTCHEWQRVTVNSITDYFRWRKTMGSKRSSLHTLMHIIWLRRKVNSVSAGPTSHEWQRVAVNSITDYFRGVMLIKCSYFYIWAIYCNRINNLIREIQFQVLRGSLHWTTLHLRIGMR